MRHTRTKLMLAAALCAGMLAMAGNAPAVTTSLHFQYASSYYSRGFDWGNGQSGFWRMTADVSTTVAGTTVGGYIWHSQGLDANADDSLDNSELDYNLYASRNFGGVSVSAVILHYTLPAAPPFASEVPEKSPFSVRTWVEANLNADIGPLINENLSLSLKAYRYLDDLIYSDEEGKYDVAYLGVAASYPAGHLSLNLAIGFADSYSNSEGDGFTLMDVHPSVSYSIPLGEETSATAILGVGYNPDAGTKQPYFKLGTGWSWSP